MNMDKRSIIVVDNKVYIEWETFLIPCGLIQQVTQVWDLFS